MKLGSKRLEKIVNMLKLIEGIGEKSALRYALDLLNKDSSYLLELSELIRSMATDSWKCSKCFNITDSEGLCNICQDPERDNQILCVVQNIPSLVAIERTREFKGKYHVLENLINLLNGILPEDTTIPHLLKRLEEEEIKELIFAVPATNEGELTMDYIRKSLEGKKLKITRLASGVPIGNAPEHIDELTLIRSLAERKEV